MQQSHTSQAPNKYHGQEETRRKGSVQDTDDNQSGGDT